MARTESKKYYDVLIVVPLEQELAAFFEVMPQKIDLTKDKYLISEVDTACDLTAVVIHQVEMGKTAAVRATNYALDLIDCGMIICLGIAGGLSKDLKVGDVCYSSNIADVLDNAKFSDIEAGMDIQLSPRNYRSPTRAVYNLSLVRTNPKISANHRQWQEDQKAYADLEFEALGLDPAIRGLVCDAPSSMPGFIVCGAVTKSEKYNAKLRSLDRAVLAVETESGGIFLTADERDIKACLTIRGISDLADKGKNVLENQTKGLSRKCAAHNAVSFLQMQFQNPHFYTYLKSLSSLNYGKEDAIAIDEQVSSLQEALKNSILNWKQD